MRKIATGIVSLLISTCTILPAYGQSSTPSLSALMLCSHVTDFHVSEDEWQITEHTACTPTAYGGSYIYYSATKGDRLIIWTSEGGNGIRWYTIVSINLETDSYIEYEAVLGIRGDGFVNSVNVTDIYGDDVIPINNVLTVLAWERVFYSSSELDGLTSPPSEDRQPFATGLLVGESGTSINVRDWAGMDAPIRHRGFPGDTVTVWESQVVDEYVWYKVAFYGSNIVGWVRSDVIRIQIR